MPLVTLMRDRKSALQRAVERGDVKTVRRSVQTEFDLNRPDAIGETHLHRAASRPNVGVAKELLNYGADCNVQNNEGCTPLHVAVIANNHKLVQLMLSHGANPLVKNSHGQRPLDIATQTGIRQLLRNNVIESDSDNDDNECHERSRLRSVGMGAAKAAYSDKKCDVRDTVKPALMLGECDVIRKSSPHSIVKHIEDVVVHSVKVESKSDCHDNAGCRRDARFALTPPPEAALFFRPDKRKSASVCRKRCKPDHYRVSIDDVIHHQRHPLKLKIKLVPHPDNVHRSMMTSSLSSLTTKYEYTSSNVTEEHVDMTSSVVASPMSVDDADERDAAVAQGTPQTVQRELDLTDVRRRALYTDCSSSPNGLTSSEVDQRLAGYKFEDISDAEDDNGTSATRHSSHPMGALVDCGNVMGALADCRYVGCVPTEATDCSSAKATEHRYVWTITSEHPACRSHLCCREVERDPNRTENVPTSSHGVASGGFCCDETEHFDRLNVENGRCSSVSSPTLSAVSAAKERGEVCDVEAELMSSQEQTPMMSRQTFTHPLSCDDANTSTNEVDDIKSVQTNYDVTSQQSNESQQRLSTATKPPPGDQSEHQLKAADPAVSESAHVDNATYSTVGMNLQGQPERTTSGSVYRCKNKRSKSNIGASKLTKLTIRLRRLPELCVQQNVHLSNKTWAQFETVPCGDASDQCDTRRSAQGAAAGSSDAIDADAEVEPSDEVDECTVSIRSKAFTTNPFSVYSSLKRKIMERQEKLIKEQCQGETSVPDWMLSCRLTNSLSFKRSYDLHSDASSAPSYHGNKRTSEHDSNQQLADTADEQENYRVLLADHARQWEELKLRHLQEQVRLVLVAEQELVRDRIQLHATVSPANERLSACAVMKTSSDVENGLYRDVINNLVAHPLANTVGLAKKFEKLKDELLCRQSHEMDVLNSTQRMERELQAGRSPSRLKYRKPYGTPSKSLTLKDEKHRHLCDVRLSATDFEGLFDLWPAI